MEMNDYRLYYLIISYNKLNSFTTATNGSKNEEKNFNSSRNIVFGRRYSTHKVETSSLAL